MKHGIHEIIESVPLPSTEWMRENKIIPASTTSLSTMDTCPMKFNGSYGVTIEKVPYVQNKAAIYGDLAHESIENYLKYDIPISQRFLNDMPNLMRKVDYVKNHHAFNPAMIEKDLAINANGDHTWRTRALGVKSDVIIDVSPSTKIYIDWKTDGTHNWRGIAKQPSPKSIQVELTAIIMFMQFPEMTSLICTLEFLMHDKKYVYVFKRDKSTYTTISPAGFASEGDFKYPIKIAKYWALQKARNFPQQPSGLCNGWCEVSTCPEWKPKSTAQKL